MQLRRAITSVLDRVFGLDLRSLAVFRVAIGLVLLADLAVRGSDFTAMYSAGGFARASMVRELQRTPLWSLHLFSDSTAYQASLFAAEALAAVALIFGCFTRLATFAAFVLVASLQVRLPVVINAGDTMLRVMLFWSLFLPLGRVWSVDARYLSPPPSPRVASTGTAAFMIQLAIVYWFAGWAKWNDAWLERNALLEVFHCGYYSMPLSTTLARYPDLTFLLSRGTVWLELVGPCFLFFPWRTGLVRTLLVAVFVAFHLGIAVTVTVGLFSYVAMATWLAILPTQLWGALGRSNANAESGLQTSAGGSRRLLHGLAMAFCGFALATVVYGHFFNVTKVRLPDPAHHGLRAFAHVSQLRQAWGVFGRPPSKDCWFVYQVLLKDGRRLDLLSRTRGTEHEKPALPSQQFDNHRWRKLHWRLAFPTAAAYRQAVAEYVTRQWNESHPPSEQIVRLDFYCNWQPIRDGGPTAVTTQKLAEVVVSSDGGNFAEAVRNLDGL